MFFLWVVFFMSCFFCLVTFSVSFLWTLFLLMLVFLLILFSLNSLNFFVIFSELGSVLFLAGMMLSSSFFTWLGLGLEMMLSPFFLIAFPRLFGFFSFSYNWSLFFSWYKLPFSLLFLSFFTEKILFFFLWFLLSQSIVSFLFSSGFFLVNLSSNSSLLTLCLISYLDFFWSFNFLILYYLFIFLVFCSLFFLEKDSFFVSIFIWSPLQVVLFYKVFLLEDFYLFFFVLPNLLVFFLSLFSSLSLVVSQEQKPSKSFTLSFSVFLVMVFYFISF